MRAVLLNSGGIDSRVAGAILRSQGWHLDSLFIDWNPAVPSVESAAAETAEMYCDSHHVHRFGDDWRIPLPALNTTAIPYTAVASHTLGSMYAATLGVTYVASGVRAEVASSREWLHVLRRLYRFNRVSPIPIFVTPVYEASDGEVFATADRLGVPLASTVSCMVAEPSCGTCNSCQRRKETHLT